LIYLGIILNFFLDLNIRLIGRMFFDIIWFLIYELCRSKTPIILVIRMGGKFLMVFFSEAKRIYSMLGRKGIDCIREYACLQRINYAIHTYVSG
jgi:hypothetical protein